MSNLFLFILFFFSSSLTVSLAAAAAGEEKNPFTPKAFAMRYWDKSISNTLPKPSFLISKASPLTAVESAKYADLAAANALSTRLPEFCSAANLLCFPDTATGPSLLRDPRSGEFDSYSSGQNFSSYGTRSAGGFSSFKNYSNGLLAFVSNEFRQYSRASGGGSEKFSSYGSGGNIADESFHTYGKNTGGGTGDFTTYTSESNDGLLGFTTYSEGAAGRQETFSHYSESGNTGKQTFSNYGKSAAAELSAFDSYGNNSNSVESEFSNYGEGGASPNDTFTNYGNNMNDPTVNFRTYGRDTAGGMQSFKNYRDQASTGDDSFESYAKGSALGAEVEFANYDKSLSGGSDTFKGYAKNATRDPKVGFKEYGLNTTFKDYNKDAASVSFSTYINTTSSESSLKKVSGSLVNKWIEPGKFFREKMLKEGTVMPMPDIRDKMPRRSFLPRSILTKLPFTSSELKRVFKVSNNSSMDTMISNSLGECERAPSKGETKRCVSSVEDMIDFATSVLGRDIAVRTTENVSGSKNNVMVGRVKGINGGKTTKSVSCHQSLFPYLLYYCHSVPKVRVYESDLLDPKTKVKINHGVAICHLDTTTWSPTHGAFLALGSSPGRIEVCHWIFENDMTWTIAN